MNRILFAFALAVLAVSCSPSAGETLRTFEPLDRSYGYRFDYPLASHSVRTSNLMMPQGVDVPFGALISVEPNDSHVFEGGAEPTYVTRMRVLAGFNSERVPDADEDALLAALGTSPLLTYDAEGLDVEQFTLGGQPAVRTSGIPVAPGSGATEIVTVFEGLLYQIVIEPVPTGLGFDPEADVRLDPVFEDILDTWAFGSGTSATGP